MREWRYSEHDDHQGECMSAFIGDGLRHSDATARPGRGLRAQPARVILGFTQSDHANEYSSFDDGYRPGAEQRAAVLVVTDAPDGLTAEQWAEAAFIASNAPGAFSGDDPAVTALRSALDDARHAGTRLRSLSVGDTVTVEGETVACAKAGWERVEDAGTWTFCGHWGNDRIQVEYTMPGEVSDDRIDIGYWEQGLWAATAGGPSMAVAEQIAIAAYETDDSPD